MLSRLAAAAALALAPLPSSAEATFWKNVAGWDVAFYDGDQGCSASTTFEGGITFYLGLASDADGVYLTIFMTNPQWASIAEGQTYDIFVRFGSRAPWNLDMNGATGGGGLSFLHDASAPDAQRFIDEFMDANAMEWTYKGNSLGRLSLSGSTRAFREVITCTQSYLDAAGGDPFSASDPFQ
jgi:hypothetical protein